MLVGLISKRLTAPLFAWPILIGLCAFFLSKFKLLRYTGFIAVLPVSILAFEILWSSVHPGTNAERHKTFDRSHYTPGFRVTNPQVKKTDPDAFGWGLNEILVGRDGFRADPNTGEGNPERCRFVLIGDSMIYGSGLRDPVTVGPVLTSMGIRACVFGVTGNSPVDYLATLKYVAARIDPGAYVAFYLYAYNDFVSLNKYFSRGFLALSNWAPGLFEWADYFNNWRQATFVFSLIRTKQERSPRTLWQYDVGKKEPIKLLYPRDPAEYVPPRPLNKRQRAALDFFFKRLADMSQGRSWRVVIVIHPDDSEIYANFARRSPTFVDLDLRRADGLKMCQEYSFVCEDLSQYLYERSFAEGKNPYFVDDRHFSVFGTRVVAEHFSALTKRLTH